MESNRKPRLLFVDDQEHLINSYLLHLRDAFDVDKSASVEEGIRKLRSSNFDVVVVDMAFPPDMQKGLEILDFIDDNPVSTKAIVLTGHGNVGNCRQAHRRGVFEYIEKGQTDDVQQVLAAAKEAASVGQILQLEFTGKAAEDFEHLKSDLKADGKLVVNEAIRMLNWAVMQWKKGARVLAKSMLATREYPDLLKERKEM